MRWIIFITLLSFMSCSSQVPVRHISSYESFSILENDDGEISYEKSRAYLIPTKDENSNHTYYIYIELKNEKGNFVSSHEEDFRIQSKKREPIPFTIKSVAKGRYYLRLDMTQIRQSEIDVLVKEHSLKKKLRLNFERPHQDKCKIILQNYSQGRALLRLKLLDAQERPVDDPEIPELIIDGDGFVNNLSYLGKGVWEFNLTHSEENQIIYISVRAQGVYLHNLYRYQYVDK